MAFNISSAKFLLEEKKNNTLEELEQKYRNLIDNMPAEILNCPIAATFDSLYKKNKKTNN